jgi:hypothetical protein
MSDFLDHASDFVGDTVDMLTEGAKALPEALPEAVAGGYDYLTGDTVGYDAHVAELEPLGEPADNEFEQATGDLMNMATDVGLL